MVNSTGPMYTRRRTAAVLLPLTAAVLLLVVLVASWAPVCPQPATPQPGDAGYVHVTTLPGLEWLDVDAPALLDAVSRDLGQGPAVEILEWEGDVREADDTGRVCVCSESGHCAHLVVSADVAREYWRRYKQLRAQNARKGGLFREYWRRWSAVARGQYDR